MGNLPAPKKIYVQIFVGAAPVQSNLPAPKKIYVQIFIRAAPVQLNLPPNFRISVEGPSVLHRCSLTYQPTCTEKNICPDFHRCCTGAVKPTTLPSNILGGTFGAAPVQS